MLQNSCARMLETVDAAALEVDAGQGVADRAVLSRGVPGVGCRVTYATARHPAGIVAGGAGRRSLLAGGVPAGMCPGSVYESATPALDEGDIGIIVTDGITEPIEWDGLIAAHAIESAVAKVPRSTTPSLECERVMRLAEDRGRTSSSEAEPDDGTVLACVVHPPA